MKRKLSTVLSVLVVLTLMLGMTVTAAAAENQAMKFSLEVPVSDSVNSVVTKNSNYDITVPAGAEIVITYRIANPSDKKANTATVQDQILYDHNFFELVEGSNRILSGDYEEAFSTSNPVDSADSGYKHYIYFNSTADVGFKGGSVNDIGTFILKVIASSGSSTVQNTELIASQITGAGAISYYDCVGQDLTVTVSGSAQPVKPVAVTGVSLNKQSAALKAGETIALSATIAPSNATNKSVTWSSSNNAVASVDTNGTVTAKAEGTATITATTQDGTKTATCTVTVTKGDVFTVNASCGTGGTITPGGEQIVKKGEDISFTFKANENYAIKDVKIDGVSNAAAIESGSYTFRDVEENHSIAVAFEKTGDAPVSNPFSDVKEGEYYYDAVLWAVENGVTQGTSTTTFSPTSLVTRAQMVTFLWRAAGCPEPTGSAGKFTDVQRGSYYEKAVAWAIERGITKGTSATTFSPDTVCTRAQVVTLLARFAGVQDAVTQSVFSDVKSTDYFAAAVNWAKDNGVTSGTSATTFSPNANCTRGQIVTFLYRWMVR